MRGEEPATETRPDRRAVLYCLIPSELGPKLHAVLRTHFRDDPRIEVVVEQRSRERRSGAERRVAGGERPVGRERRRIRGAAGRRVGERRAAAAPVAEGPMLPLRARRFASQLSFVERLEPSTQHSEDLDTARLVARFQAGERGLFDVLYTRYFSRVYGYLRAVLRDSHEAEDATQEVFVKLIESLPRYELRGVPFRGWLFALVRHHAVDQLRKLGRVEVVPTEEIPEPQPAAAAEPEGPLQIMNWLSDRDLQIFVERLPIPQRQVLVMRYMLGFGINEIGTVLGKKPNTVSALHLRALRSLEDRLRAIGRAPTRGESHERSRSRRWVRQATVLRARRFALTKF